MTVATSVAETPEAKRPSARVSIIWLVRRLGLVLALAALADWFFFNGFAIGLSLALFLAACGGLVLAANPIRATIRQRCVAAAAFAVALGMLVEDVSWLSVLVAIPLALGAARLLVLGGGEAWPARLSRAWVMPFTGPARLARDVRRVRRLAPKSGAASANGRQYRSWIMPVLLFLTFLVLFAAANPVLENWLGAMDPRSLIRLVSVPRTAFWIGIICLVWPLAHLTARRPRKAVAAMPRPPEADSLAELFGTAAVLRALILFNALFALQTGLDMAYLWGGLDLPDGMTHAAYAHRGAYPLILTALLAAAFVLVAIRPGGAAEGSRWIRPLVLVFVAQNVMLVASSVLRTVLYVDAYGLTELRLAALIWMALVGVGLVLIVAQIRTRRSNAWLLDANAVALLGTLVLCCFVNFPYMVARYNMMHWQERGGMPTGVDVDYLVSLGPQALPAYLPILSAQEPGRFAGSQEARLRRVERNVRKALDEADWRSWTFRDFRLQRYLDAFPLSSPAAPAIEE